MPKRDAAVAVIRLYDACTLNHVPALPADDGGVEAGNFAYERRRIRYTQFLRFALIKFYLFSELCNFVISYEPVIRKEKAPSIVGAHDLLAAYHRFALLHFLSVP